MAKSNSRPNHWRQRERRDKLLIVIDARQTERQYFEQFKGKKSPTVPSVKIITRGTDPLKAVNYAKDLFRTGDFDEAWCVFDQDDYGAGRTFDKAIAAAGKKICLAVSCPSFELWLLLHFEACGAYLDQKDALRRLKKHVANYDKARLCCETFRPHLPTAITRAKQLDLQHGRPHQNPSTGVWRLVERLAGDRNAT